MGALETSSSSIIRNMLTGSDYISFRSVSEFRDDLEEGRICQVTVAFPLPRRAICLLQRNGGKKTAAVEAFLQCAREAALMFQEQ